MRFVMKHYALSQPLAEEKALTTEEACVFLSISRQTLYKLVKGKKLPGHKVGEKYRFFKSEILEHFKHGA